jgi:hypothetical protein
VQKVGFLKIAELIVKKRLAQHGSETENIEENHTPTREVPPIISLQS